MWNLSSWAEVQHVIISGTEKQTAAIRAAVDNAAIDDSINYNYVSPGMHVHCDNTAIDTEDNARHVIKVLGEYPELKDKPIVLVSFPVLTKGCVDALVHRDDGVDLANIYPAFLADEIDTDILSLGDGCRHSIKDGWVDLKMEAAKKGTWTGKGKAKSLEDRFNEAADMFKNGVPKSNSAQKADKLILYGLYKQATNGDNTTEEPWAVQAKSKAKWTAWKEQEGKSKVEAMEAYVAEVNRQIGAFQIELPTQR